MEKALHGAFGRPLAPCHYLFANIAKISKCAG